VTHKQDIIPRIIKKKIYRYTREDVLVQALRPYTNQPHAWLVNRLYNNKKPFVVNKYDLIDVLCPNCEPDNNGKGGCVCSGKKLTYSGSLDTEWHGTLHFWRCRCCKEKLVCQDGKEIRISAT